jgi:gluconokinase
VSLPSPATRALVLMGVSGSGKTTIGQGLADALGWRFVDADDLHPPANVAKMRAGTPLDDADREPWLERLNALLRHAVAKDERVVLACSALKARYRKRLAGRLEELAFVHLQGDFELIRARAEVRQHRYMPAALLRSQFDALEAPTDALVLDIRHPPQALVEMLRARLAPRA